VVAPSSQILVDGAISRLGLWLDSLEAEFTSAIVAHRERQDLGAVNYLRLMQDILGRYRRGFERYRAQAAAPSDQRLRWLQQVGSGLAELEHLFGKISVPLAPTLTPLSAAFTRLLENLVPGRPPTFRPVRDFNYEIEEFHSDDFVDLLLAGVSAHQWPMLFITLPTGLLDSPRAHVLVGHEIGHAVAAVHRERVVLNESERDEANAAGEPLPPEVAPLLPVPAPPRTELLEIAKERWKEAGLPTPTSQPGVPSKPSVGGALILEVLAEVGADASELAQAWLEELFSDAIATALFGPAFLVSMLDVLLTTGSMERGTYSHPPLAARLQCVGRTLQHTDLGFNASVFPPRLRERFETAMAEADAVLKVPLRVTPSTRPSDTRLFSVVRDLVLGRVDDVVTIAVERAKECDALYTATRFTQDLATYMAEFVQAGVPPIDRDATMATVFNVGQVLCSDYLNSFCPGVDDRDKERRVDDLLLKAIEVNEIFAMWQEA